MRAGLAGMVTLPLAGATVAGKVAVAAAGAAPVVLCDDEPHAAVTANSTAAAMAVMGFTVWSFTLSSCRPRGCCSTTEDCRSTCPFLACVVATDRPGDLARPPKRNDSCGTAPDSHRTSLHRSVAGREPKPAAGWP